MNRTVVPLSLLIVVLWAVLQPAEVLAFYHVAGADDFLVHVAVRDSHHLRGFLLAAFTQREEVAHIETHLIFEYRRNPEVPVYLRPES